MSQSADFAVKLINAFQHGMPICAQPYLRMAEQLGCSEQDVIDCLDALKGAGVLSRVGPVFDHRRAGASTLAALPVPQKRLEEVAAIVNEYREVNHNYERDGQWNLWFVLTAADPQQLDGVLRDIERRTGLKVLNLPMIRPFHIDLGFPIDSLGEVVLS